MNALLDEIENTGREGVKPMPQIARGGIKKTKIEQRPSQVAPWLRREGGS